MLYPINKNNKNKLKEIRQLLGYCQANFAILLGIHRKTLYRWENESEPNIDIRVLKILYDIGINPFYINYDEPLFRPNYDLSKVWENIKK